ncbi:MAG: hypothetical protein ACOY9J_09675 [Pseudomonadota bacterium]
MFRRLLVGRRHFRALHAAAGTAPNATTTAGSTTGAAAPSTTAVNTNQPIKSFETDGLQVRADALPGGVQLIHELEKSGFDPEDALRTADRFVLTGSTPLLARPIDVTDTLYKVVPAGNPVGAQSAYWMTADELQILQQNPGAVADRLALPNGTANTTWDIYAITNKSVSKATFRPRIGL